MPLFPCPECLNFISTKATACPHCGNPLEPINENEYEIKMEQVTCRGFYNWDAVIEQLQDDIDDGWEIVYVVEVPYGGILMKRAYDVLLKRSKDPDAYGDRSTADLWGNIEDHTSAVSKSYGDIAEFQAEINALPTADLKLIVEDQADLYTAEEMAFIRAVLARRGKL